MTMGPDKLGRETGPGDGGFLVTDQDIPQHAVLEFILANFNIDGNLLKPAHKTLLDQHIVPFVRANKVHVELTGTASQTGSASYDKELSRERAFRVRQYLMRRGLSNAQVASGDVHAAGKALSTSRNVEDALDRAVRIRIVVGVRKAPLPAQPHIVVPQVVPPQVVQVPEMVIEVDTRVPWAIQELTGFNIGVGVSVGALGLSVGVQAGTVEYHFLLVNSRTRQMAECRYFGPAAGGGVSLKAFDPGFSITKGSHVWDKFKTPAGTGFDDFAGGASWQEAGVGLGTGTSKNRLFLHGLGITVDVSTGVTLGTPSATVSTGNFFLKPPMQLQL
jgi:hypothetical protein